MNLTTVVGIVGAALLLAAFTLLQIKKIKQETVPYQAMNFFGGLLLVVYGILIQGYPFVVLNGLWTVVAFRELIIRKKL